VASVSSRLTGRFGRVVANVLAVGLIALAAHSWPVREYLRNLAAVRAAQMVGGDVSIGELRYNLSTLAIEINNVLVSSRRDDIGGELFVRQLIVDLSWPALLAGRIEAERLRISNLDASASAPGDQTEVTLRGLALSMSHQSPGGLAGKIDLHGTSRVRVRGSPPRGIDYLDGLLRYDGGALHLTDVRTAVDGIVLVVNGRVADALGAEPRAALSGTWRASASEFCAIGLPQATFCDRVRDGTLHGRLTFDGALASPELHIEAAGDGQIAGTPLRVTIDGEASVSSHAMTIVRLEATGLGGRAALTATVPFGEDAHTSSVKLHWETIDVRALFDLIGFRAPPTATLTGHALFTGDVWTPSSVSAEVSARFATARGARLPVTGEATARLREGHWVLRLASFRIGGTSVDGVASSRVRDDMPGGWAAMPIDGSIRVEMADVRETWDALQEFGLSASVPSNLRSWHVRGSTELALGGTVERPRLTGRMQASAERPGDASATAAQAVVRIERDRIDVAALRVTHAADEIAGAFS
jgi:hypothetical protein